MSLVGTTLAEEDVRPMEVVQDPSHPIALVEPDREIEANEQCIMLASPGSLLQVFPSFDEPRS